MRFNRTVSIVGAHAEGEVGNVIVGGVVDVPGVTAFEKMEHLRDHGDALRRAILFEPRGAPSHAVNLLLPTARADADLGFVIMEATKYPAMSGSNTICVATVVLETGIRPMREPETILVLEAPGGLVRATCECRDGKVLRVRLAMLPSFVLRPSVAVDVPGHGVLDIAIVYGGIFYAILPAAALGLELGAASAAAVVRAGIAIRDAVNRSVEAVHPENSKLRGVANVVVTGDLRSGPGGMRETVSATVIGNGRLDRSPCGTGVAARMALLYAEGQIGLGEPVRHHSVFGTWFDSRIEGVATVGGLPAVIPEIAGRAWITGFTQMVIDPSDPLSEGHCPTDLWLSGG